MIALGIGIGGGLAQNAVDVARLIKKYPEALHAGRYVPSLGSLGRLPTAIGTTLYARPDSRIIDPMAPRMASLASAGRSFTRFDEVAMKTSTLLGASLAGLQLFSGVMNLRDALDRPGTFRENAFGTSTGRTGMLQIVGGTMGVGLFATGLKQTSGAASGFFPRIIAAGKAPILAKPLVAYSSFGLACLVIANELGYLDSLNAGETRPVSQVLSDAAHRTPVLNSSALRTTALVGATGLIGMSAIRAARAAGGIGGLSKLHWIGGAIAGGLLGAQMLGLLDGLNKPS